jgi:hypothetical protein
MVNMKRVVLIILFVQVFSGEICAQGKYGNYWVFSQFLGLNFNAGNLPVADTSNIYGPWFPTSSICDKDGNLVCYVGTWKWAEFDIRLYNKYHTLVKGGDQLFVQTGGQYSIYSGYTGLLTFKDEIDKLILVKFSVSYTTTDLNLNYSLIDTKAYMDTGTVYSANNKVLDFKGVIGPIGLIRHANGRDWWILIHGYPNDKYYKFLASPDKVEFVGDQSIGTKCGILNPTFSNMESMGEFSVNLQGDKIAFCNLGGLIETYDFDRCTGTLSNVVTLQTVYSGNNSVLNTMTANISPSGRFVYAVSYYNQPPGPGPVSSNLGQIVQYDLQATDPANDTVVVYGFRDIDSYIDQLEYGPDGRMWFTGRGDTNLYHNLLYPQDSFMHFIEFPDVKGTACNVKFNQVYMNGRRALAGLPNMPNYNLGPIDGSVCDTLGLDVSRNTLEPSPLSLPSIYPNPSGGQGAVLIIPQPQLTNGIIIYDATGKLIWEIQSDSDTINLPSHLPLGLYRVVVNGGVGVSWRVE